MKIGFVGTGKLGLPVSLIYASKGHTLYCYDINQKLYDSHMDCLEKEERSPDDDKISLKQYLIDLSINLDVTFTTLEYICFNSDIIFIAVQTPHEKEYEGINRIQTIKKDFDYSYLLKAFIDVSNYININQKNTIVSIISTVLPGTLKQFIEIKTEYMYLIYNPYFIAMGSVAFDCLNPEFILIGYITNTNNIDNNNIIENFYKSINNNVIIYKTTIENAELIKMCYNTFISSKIAIANTIMELCHHLPGTNCDSVMNGLFLSGKRLISTAYLNGGMGDGGGCHPRDNIAMSYLSNKLNLKYNWFDQIMLTRDKQTEFLADVIYNELLNNNNNNNIVIILGKSFKKNTSIVTGSPALLLATMLDEKNIKYKFFDPFIKDCFDPKLLENNNIFFIACCHDIFFNINLPGGSILIDPFRKYKEIIKNGKYIPIGINNI